MLACPSTHLLPQCAASAVASCGAMGSPDAWCRHTRWSTRASSSSRSISCGGSSSRFGGRKRPDRWHAGCLYGVRHSSMHQQRNTQHTFGEDSALHQPVFSTCSPSHPPSQAHIQTWPAEYKCCHHSSCIIPSAQRSLLHLIDIRYSRTAHNCCSQKKNTTMPSKHQTHGVSQHIPAACHKVDSVSQLMCKLPQLGH